MIKSPDKDLRTTPIMIINYILKYLWSMVLSHIEHFDIFKQFLRVSRLRKIDP